MIVISENQLQNQKKEKPKLVCSTCDKVYVNQKSFDKHVCPAFSYTKQKLEEENKENYCSYCKKNFKNARSFYAHMCEQKRRWNDQDTKYVKLGFSIFKRFHEFKGRKEKTFEDFIKSSFYTTFTHFGRYLLNMNAIRPKDFIDFLIKHQVKMNKWESQTTYETYIRELNKRETPDAAIERTLLLMEQWSNDTGEPLTDFFRKITPVLATQWIRSGRISPWLLFASSSGSDLLQRLSEEQQSLVWQNIDPAFWEFKILKAGNDIDVIRETLDAVGL
jgi:hypothetical protein